MNPSLQVGSGPSGTTIAYPLLSQRYFMILVLTRKHNRLAEIQFTNRQAQNTQSLYGYHILPKYENTHLISIFP